MKFNSTKRGAAALMASVAMTASMSLSAQEAAPAPSEAAAEEEVIATVYGTPPADLTGLADGPRIEGFISGTSEDAINVTSADGTTTAVLLGPSTEVKARGGLFGIGRTALTTQALLEGLPVRVDTVRWGRGLVATQVSFRARDLETAAMIRNGTAGQFAAQGAAIGDNTESIGENSESIAENEEAIAENAAAAEALRGRFADIDQYTIRSTTNVYFGSGRTNLTPRAREDLCVAANEANEIDNALLLVVGYTDSTGSQAVNQRLSERRAGAVVNYLQQQCGWQPWRMLTPTGMAESGSVASNDTAAGRAQNRRVAVNVLVSKSVDPAE